MKTSTSFSRGAALVLLSSLPMFAVLAPGCSGKPGELCDMRCDCTHCNDIAEDLCNIQEGADQDRAAAYDCTDEYDTWIDCAIDRNSCDEEANNFTIDDSCTDERTELEECKADASSLNSSAEVVTSPQSTGQVVSSTANTGGFGGSASSSVASTVASTANTGGNGGSGGI